MAHPEMRNLYFLSIDAAAGQPVRFQPRKPVRLTNACINDPKGLDWTIVLIEHSNARGIAHPVIKSANSQRLTKESPICWLRPGDRLMLPQHMSATFDVVLSPNEEIIFRLKNSHGDPEVRTLCNSPVTITGYYMDSLESPISLSAIDKTSLKPIRHLKTKGKNVPDKASLSGGLWNTGPSASLKRVRTPSPDPSQGHKRMRGMVASPAANQAKQPKKKPIPRSRNTIPSSYPTGTHANPPHSRSPAPYHNSYAHDDQLDAGPSFNQLFPNAWDTASPSPWNDTFNMDFNDPQQVVGDDDEEAASEDESAGDSEYDSAFNSVNRTCTQHPNQSSTGIPIWVGLHAESAAESKSSEFGNSAPKQAKVTRFRNPCPPSTTMSTSRSHRFIYLDFEGQLYGWWNNPSMSQLPTKPPILFKNINGEIGVPFIDLESPSLGLGCLQDGDELCDLGNQKLVFGWPGVEERYPKLPDGQITMRRLFARVWTETRQGFYTRPVDRSEWFGNLYRERRWFQASSDDDPICLAWDELFLHSLFYVGPGIWQVVFMANLAIPGGSSRYRSRNRSHEDKVEMLPSGSELSAPRCNLERCQSGLTTAFLTVKRIASRKDLQGEEDILIYPPLAECIPLVSEEDDEVAFHSATMYVFGNEVGIEGMLVGVLLKKSKNSAHLNGQSRFSGGLWLYNLFHVFHGGDGEDEDKAGGVGRRILPGYQLRSISNSVKLSSQLALSSSAHPRLWNAPGVSDPRLRFRSLLEPYVDNVGQQLKSELRTMPSDHPVYVLWHQVASPMKVLKQAQAYVVRYPPRRDFALFSDPDKWIILRDELIHILLLKLVSRVLLIISQAETDAAFVDSGDAKDDAIQGRNREIYIPSKLFRPCDFIPSAHD
ncbi:hypothetical protein SISSUDRAFT_1037150 [Sistotremastrum suecicum HHB10207 ss-3]|uniref:Nucleoplasmin-like domain-containing protein n=1 Tax=Sistotremastrum suecicum HHB10207 ss-3 TaxID=1314776 RepID=A0A165YIY6_9AGAM|nr:hypothetical protein SISSUDRAFT_1037150 [Sistotremastrum suecicum HHB10207 ss-3]